MAWTPYYKPKFYRHLNHLVINGFYARSLDADDHEFLEYVKTKGIANGSLPSSSAVLIEELGFWQLPYEIQPGIERRVGSRAIRKPPPVPETPEERERRKARSSRWRAQREIRKQEREIAAIELAREEREHAEANRRRTVREIITDAEWDAAAPKEAPFGAIIDGKYVPEWKLEEQGIVRPVPLGPKSRSMTRAEVKEAIRLRTESQRVAERKQRQIAERAAIRKRLIAAQKLEDEARNKSVERAHKRREDREKGRREKILADARETLLRVALMESEWSEQANYSPEVLKQAILSLLNSTPGQAWTPDTMMKSIGGCTREFLDKCLAELVRDGRLRKMDTPP